MATVGCLVERPLLGWNRCHKWGRVVVVIWSRQLEEHMGIKSDYYSLRHTADHTVGSSFDSIFSLVHSNKGIDMGTRFPQEPIQLKLQAHKSGLQHELRGKYNKICSRNQFKLLLLLWGRLNNSWYILIDCFYLIRPRLGSINSA